MKMSFQSNFQLLRTQVYEHLREELKIQNLKPGMFVTINQLSKQLGISQPTASRSSQRGERIVMENGFKP